MGKYHSDPGRGLASRCSTDKKPAAVAALWYPALRGQRQGQLEGPREQVRCHHHVLPAEPNDDKPGHQRISVVQDAVGQQARSTAMRREAVCLDADSEL